MKMVITALVLGVALSVSGAANATSKTAITDELLLELAQGGQKLNPHGIWAGR